VREKSVKCVCMHVCCAAAAALWPLSTDGERKRESLLLLLFACSDISIHRWRGRAGGRRGR